MDCCLKINVNIQSMSSGHCPHTKGQADGKDDEFDAFVCCGTLVQTAH